MLYAFCGCFSILKRDQIDDEGKRERFVKIHINLLRNKSWREKVHLTVLLPNTSSILASFSMFLLLGCSVTCALE